MRTLLVAIGALVAGCISPGLTLEITTTDPAIKRVELMVGALCDPDCPDSVAPPGLASKPTAIFLIDDPSVWSADVVDGIAGFVLRVDQDRQVPLIVAVGFDARDGGTAKEIATLHDATIPAGQAVRWRVPLAPALPIDDAVSTSPERVALWRQATAPGLACVMVEHWTSDGVERDLLVPRDDRDCDQLPAGECAPWTPLAVSSPGTIDRASCLVHNSASGNTVCMLGGPTCSEVGGISKPCEVLGVDYCAPTPLCLGCAPWNEACVASQVRTATTPELPRIWCDLPLTATGSPCAGSDVQVSIDAAAFLTSSTAKCKDVRVNDIRTPLGAFDQSVTIDNAKIDVGDLAQPCMFTAKFSGQITQGAHVEPLLLDLALDNGNHLVIPFAVALVISGDACMQTPRCQVLFDASAASDPMFTCTGPTTSVGTCAPQGSCVTGPPCGATCCGSGEACVGGQCKCGSGPVCGGGFTCNAGLISPGCGSICCSPTGPPLCEF